MWVHCSFGVLISCDLSSMHPPFFCFIGRPGPHLIYMSIRLLSVIHVKNIHADAHWSPHSSLA